MSFCSISFLSCFFFFQQPPKNGGNIAWHTLCKSQALHNLPLRCITYTVMQFVIRDTVKHCEALSLFQRPFSRWTWISRYQNVSILDCIGAKDDGDSGDNWRYKTCKAQVRISPSTNQRPASFRPINTEIWKCTWTCVAGKHSCCTNIGSRSRIPSAIWRYCVGVG